MHRQVLIDPINRNQYKMCSYSYVLLHAKIVFIPAKSNILPCHISHIIWDNMAFHLVAQH